MFERILFPTDFSAYANAVLACLPELRAAGLREVVLLHVIRSSDVPFPETVNRDSVEQVCWSVEEHLNLARMALEGQGLLVMTRVEYGSPAAQIVQVAEDERASLIVIGAHGRTAIQELLVGSTFENVARLSRHPVLVVRRRAELRSA